MFNQNIISNKFDLNLSTTLSSYVNGRNKKEENNVILTALVAGTQQTLSNLFRDFQYL